MAEIDPIVLKLDQIISMGRLHEIAAILATDRVERLAKIMTVLSHLTPGAYLLGTGPSTAGVFPLTLDEVVLGRKVTPLEELADTVADYEVADTPYFTPREASRVHAKITRTRCNDTAVEYRILDLASTCGTFVNGTRIDFEGDGQLLGHGDVISLGPSQINTYVFYERPKDGVLPSGE